MASNNIFFGLKVVDLASFIAGPSAADTVKIAQMEQTR
jgi:hypothetical protein